jgi:O-antigen ligase
MPRIAATAFTSIGEARLELVQRRDRHLLALCLLAGGGAVASIFAARTALIILLLPAVVVGIRFYWGILRGNPAATLLLVFLSVFLIDATFRIREYADKGVDFQVLIKIVLWATLASVALVQLPRWFANVMTPTGLTSIVFILWLFITAAISPVPAYSAVAAFSIAAYLLFSAYLGAQFERSDIFLVIVLAITAVCIISIIVYFAAPEFGRFVYWHNDQRYVSGRMAGIAGSANNLGRLAALGLMLIVLHAREMQRVHRLIVPVCTVILLAALLMTNSRSSMAMVLVLCGAAMLLRWRRLHIIVLLAAIGCLFAVLVIPAGDEILKMISRSGDISEVTSMTGRSDIWAAVPKLIEGRLWTGFGYASSIFVVPAHEAEVGFLTSHAHNLILQLLLTTGWIGVGLFTISFLLTGLRAAYFSDRTILLLLGFVILNGITESSAFSSVANICTLAYALAVTLPPEQSSGQDLSEGFMQSPE